MVAYISRDINGIVTTYDEKRHDLEDGDHVRFSEVRGMTEVNGKEFQIRVILLIKKRNGYETFKEFVEYF